MPGGGISAGNVSKIITELNPVAIHFSGTVKTVVDGELLLHRNFPCNRRRSRKEDFGDCKYNHSK